MGTFNFLWILSHRCQQEICWLFWVDTIRTWVASVSLMTAVILCREGKTIWLSYGISPGAFKASLIISLLFSSVPVVISLDLNEWELIYRGFLSFQSCTCRKWYWSIFFGLSNELTNIWKIGWKAAKTFFTIFASSSPIIHQAL